MPFICIVFFFSNSQGQPANLTSGKIVVTWCEYGVCRYSLAVDWSVVNECVARMRTSDRLLLDQDCLQWTPPVHSDDDGDDDDDDTCASQVEELVILLSHVDWASNLVG